MATPTHVLTTEDRRKAAAVTNAIRREKRLLRDQLRLNEEIERMTAADRAQRWRRREQARARREAILAQERASSGFAAATGRGRDSPLASCSSTFARPPRVHLDSVPTGS
jgi:hypothetical protein